MLESLHGERMVKKGVLKVYEGFPHGMCTTQAAVINRDLLTFMQERAQEA